jgi:hypothetical protein
MDGPILLKSTITPQPLGGADHRRPGGAITVLQGRPPQGCPPWCGGARVPL